MMKRVIQWPAFSMTNLALGVALFLAAGAVLHALWGGYARGRTPAAGGERDESSLVTAPALPSPAVFLKSATTPDRVVSNLFHSAYVDRALLKLAEEKASRAAAQKAAREKSMKEEARLAVVIPPP